MFSKAQRHQAHMSYSVFGFSYIELLFPATYTDYHAVDRQIGLKFLQYVHAQMHCGTRQTFDSRINLYFECKPITTTPNNTKN